MFTESELEKDPLKEVPSEPYELLDKTRYDFSSKQLPLDREAQLDSIMNKLREECQIKGIMVNILSMHLLSANSPNNIPSCSAKEVPGKYRLAPHKVQTCSPHT